MTIYQRIKNLRESKGMSQQELAEKVGFKTASAVNKIELGLRDINQSKIKAFAEALDTTSCYLLDGTATSKDPAISLILTEQEKALIIAYRKHPDMQKSVNLLLGINSDNFSAERLTAALKEKGGGAEIRAMNDSEKEAVINKTFAEDF